MNDVCIEILKKVLSIYSPSGKEREAVKYLVEVSRDHGLDSYIDQYGNFIARIGSGSFRIAFISHIDTVPGYIQVKISNNKIFGRGSVDAKGSLVAMLCSMMYLDKYISANSYDAEVITIGCVREESDSFGAFGLIKNNFYADRVIIGEPTGGVNIAVSYRGSIKVKIKCNSMGGHSSSYWMYGDSACDKLLKLWSFVKDKLTQQSSKGISYILTRLLCGNYINVVPTHGIAFFDIRYPDRYSHIEILESLLSILPDECYIVSIVNLIPPIRVSPTNATVRGLIRSIVKLGIKPKIVAKSGTSDMNILAYRVSSNIAAFGPGDPLRSHTANEYISIQEFIHGVKVYRNFIFEEILKKR